MMTGMDPLVALDPSANEGYLRWPLPDRRDEEITGVLDALPGLLDSLDGRHADVLSVFAERMATLAVRRRSVEAVTAGLRGSAVALAVPGGDVREALPALALLYRAAELAGADPSAVFLDVARRLPPKVSEPLVAFTERAPEDRSVAAMGYMESHGDDGFRFDRAW